MNSFYHGTGNFGIGYLAEGRLITSKVKTKAKAAITDQEFSRVIDPQ